MRNLLFILLVSAASCSDSNTEETEKRKDLLSTDLVTNPVSASGTDTAAVSELPTMDFRDTLHDFGIMHEGETAVYDFEFVNNGKKPLLISSAAGSCGCTVPLYPREPLAPGAKGVIKVKFNSAEKQGHQEKSVILHSNSRRGTYTLYVKADVKPK
jgi:hypothetical protein